MGIPKADQFLFQMTFIINTFSFFAIMSVVEEASVVFFLQADLNCNIQDDTGAFYGVTSQYESSENMTITCSTKVCSFGKQVVEKVEVWFSNLLLA